MPDSVIDRNTPMRLARALELAYPEGGMTVSGLRREIARGRLAVERTAGKDFVTLASIDRMRELCRVPVSQPGYGSVPRGVAARLSGSSSTMDDSVALDAALKTAAALRKPLRPTSASDTTRLLTASAGGQTRHP